MTEKSMKRIAVVVCLAITVGCGSNNTVKQEITSYIHDEISRDADVIWIKKCDVIDKPRTISRGFQSAIRLHRRDGTEFYVAKVYLLRFGTLTYSYWLFYYDIRKWNQMEIDPDDVTNLKEF